MNKKNFTALIAVLSILALTACNNTKETANMNEVESYDGSSTDLLVDTLQLVTNFETDNNEAGQVQEDENNDQIEVTIYYGNGVSEKLNEEVINMEELTAENLISKLAGHNIVPLGTKVNSFEEEAGDRGKVLHLDLDKAFREYLKTMTSESESVILASITITFLEAYDAKSISITVDGKVLETNHATYEEPFKIAQDYIDTPSQSN